MDDLTDRALNLKSPEVRLVPLADVHAAGIVACVDDEMWSNFLSKRPTTLDETVAYVRQSHADPTRLPLAVEDARTGEFRGSTSFRRLDSRQGSVEIGITFYARKWWGGLTNPWTKLLMLQQAFDVWALYRVEFRCDSRNTRSAAAIERLGATREGVLRGHRVAADGARSDTVMFSILRPEWPAVRARLLHRVSAPPK